MKKIFVLAILLLLAGCANNNHVSSFSQFDNLGAPNVKVERMEPINYAVQLEKVFNPGSMDTTRTQCTQGVFLKQFLGKMQNGMRIDHIVNISVWEESDLVTVGNDQKRIAQCNYYGLAVQYVIY